jgi:hypothetical protein
VASVTRIPRSRGGVSGVLLIVLGAWGGLVPFVGPYFHYAYTPDKAWTYNSGRLWLSIVPGAAALLGGLLAVLATHRAVGLFGGLLAALGGAWFIVGVPVIALVVKDGSISPGSPLAGPVGALSSATRQFLESLGFFTGTGVLIVFLAALALGRFSVVSVRDAALADDGAGLSLASDAAAFPAAEEHVAESATFPATTGEFPVAGSQYPGAEQAETGQEEYPTTTSPFRRSPSGDPGAL